MTPPHIPPRIEQRLRHAVIALGAALAACSGDIVNMGENEGEAFVPPPRSQCAENPTLSGNVAIRNQAELDALEGCTTIDGHLLIVALFDPDLRPLHELRVVRGDLGLGASFFWNGGGFERAAAKENIEAGRFLRSLEGLERLETVGGLHLWGVAASSLAPLAGLRQLTEYGTLTIFDCDAIVDLSPLGKLSGIQHLQLRAGNLESLDGLQFKDSIQALAVAGQKLTSIDALSSLRSVRHISIEGTALPDLAGLAGLDETGDSVYIADNPALGSLHGLERVLGVSSLVLRNNDALNDVGALAETAIFEFLEISDNENLQRLAELERVMARSLYIADNPRLEELPAFPSMSFAGTSQEIRRSLQGEIEIARNGALERISVPSGVPNALFINIEDNAALRELDLSDIESLDLLAIRSNPALRSVRLDLLDTVDILEVVDNPLLPVTSFDSVRSFERSMSGNASAPP